jgi:hypothetical protein
MVGTSTANLKAPSGAPGGRRDRRAAKLTLASLGQMSQAELDELFRRSPAGPIPSGAAEGKGIIAPGTALADALQPLVHLAWRGKVFYPERQDLLNRIGPFGLLLARAQVYVGDSWMDGKPAIVLDYSISSLPFRAIRDEIREVALGLYLGVVYWVDTKTVNFALQFPVGAS